MPPIHKTTAQFVRYHELHALKKWAPLQSIRNEQFPFILSNDSSVNPYITKCNCNTNDTY